LQNNITFRYKKLIKLILSVLHIFGDKLGTVFNI
jgi:hypothetical protein